jgi:hypothetical protein
MPTKKVPVLIFPLALPQQTHFNRLLPFNPFYRFYHLLAWQKVLLYSFKFATQNKTKIINPSFSGIS